jgi:chromosome segregation ATPase
MIFWTAARIIFNPLGAAQSMLNWLRGPIDNTESPDLHSTEVPKNKGNDTMAKKEETPKSHIERLSEIMEELEVLRKAKVSVERKLKNREKKLADLQAEIAEKKTAPVKPKK